MTTSGIEPRFSGPLANIASSCYWLKYLASWGILQNNFSCCNQPFEIWLLLKNNSSIWWLCEVVIKWATSTSFSLLKFIVNTSKVYPLEPNGPHLHRKKVLMRHSAVLVKIIALVICIIKLLYHKVHCMKSAVWCRGIALMEQKRYPQLKFAAP